MHYRLKTDALPTTTEPIGDFPNIFFNMAMTQEPFNTPIVKKIGNSFLFNYVPSLQCLTFIFSNETYVKFLLFLVNIFLVQINLWRSWPNMQPSIMPSFKTICIRLLISFTISEYMHGITGA